MDKTADKLFEKFDKIRVTEKNYGAVKNMHDNWYYTAIKAVIGQLGKQLYSKLSKNEQRKLANCLDKIDDKRDLIHSAKCIVESRKRYLNEKLSKYSGRKPNMNIVEVPKPRGPVKVGNGTVVQWIGGMQVVLHERENATGGESKNFYEQRISPHSVSSHVTNSQRPNPTTEQPIFSKVAHQIPIIQEPQVYRDSPILPGSHRFVTKDSKSNFDPQVSSRRKLMDIPNYQSTIASRLHLRASPEASSTLQTKHPRQNFQQVQILQHVFGKKPLRSQDQAPSATDKIPEEVQKLPRKNDSQSSKFRTRMDRYGFRLRRRRAKRFIGELGENIINHRGESESETIFALPSWMENPNDAKRSGVKVQSQKRLDELTARHDKSVVSRLSNMLLELTGPKRTGEKVQREKTWSRTYEALMRANEAMEERKKSPGSKVWERRMYDLVLDRDETSLSPKERRTPMGMMHTALQLIDRLPGQPNKTERSYKTLSPRFMPLMPDKAESSTNNVLSPTILAMYNVSDGKKTDTLSYNKMDPNHIAPMPEVLSSMGMSEKDRQSIISMLMDVTRTTGHVDNGLDILQELNFMKPEVGTPLLDATERIMKAFKSLEGSFCSRQKRQIRKDGYTFLRKEQVEKLMNDQGASNTTEIDMTPFEVYDMMTYKEKQIALWLTIEKIANNDTSPVNSTVFLKTKEELHIRRKRASVILAPFQFTAPFPLITTLSPLILSPFQFAPTFGAGVLGPLILSPFIFSPPILNPTIFSPFVLSPGVADPFILSPYVFGPFILGPFVMTPFILNPYLLSPNILNPYVLSPLVLSPLALSPDIVSPMALGGAVLSPSFASPAIFTETFLMATVLSPTFLS
ncbi:moulting cycle domain-containing protein [Ditylenchus destructor]|nr:moulting cycle domain-containing protein [Ditylenchus destructor]